MKTTEETTKYCYDQGYADAMADAREMVSTKAAMIDKLLYSDEAMNIRNAVTGRQFDRLWNKRSNLQSKSIALWLLAGKIYEEEVKHAV